MGPDEPKSQLQQDIDQFLEDYREDPTRTITQLAIDTWFGRRMAGGKPATKPKGKPDIVIRPEDLNPKADTGGGFQNRIDAKTLIDRMRQKQEQPQAGQSPAGKSYESTADLVLGESPAPTNASKVQVQDLVESGGYRQSRIGGLDRPRLEAGTKAKIEAAQQKNAAGQFLDNKGNVIKEPTRGHIQGRENRRILEAADRLGLNQSQVDKFVNAHPHYFEIQEKKFNLSHQGELLGPDPGALKKIVGDMEKFFGL